MEELDKLTRAQRFADSACWFFGSWTFIIIASVFTFAWIIINAVAWYYQFDPYPFILLNLVFTIIELYQGPLIMMSQNREMERDRDTVKSIHEKLDRILENKQNGCK